MQTPDQLEKRLKKYFKVDLTQETLEKLSRADDLCELKLKLLDKVSSYISIALMTTMKNGFEKWFDKRFLYRELSETFSFRDDLSKTTHKLQRLHDIIYKARVGQDLSIVEYNWLQKELKKLITILVKSDTFLRSVTNAEEVLNCLKSTYYIGNQ